MTPEQPSARSGGVKAGTHHFSQNAERRPLLQFVKSLNTVFTRVYHNLTVTAPPQLPDKGAAILVCNHTSGLDPLLLQSICKRVVIWMMAKEYYDIRPLKPAFKLIEAIPVDRGSRDTSATRLALRALQDGRVLGVFPEGRIAATRDLLPFQPGVALMAIKTKAPVYPAYLEGTQRGKEIVQALTHRNRATLRFGPEVNFDRSSTSHEALEAATATIQAAVAALRD